MSISTRIGRWLNTVFSAAPNDPFEQLVERSEQLSAAQTAPRKLDDFERLVQDALDALPDRFQAVLATVPVVVSDRGAEVHAYGQYFGDTVARDRYEDRIIIYRDTLLRDFGHDKNLLAAQIERTVRHEVAHHLGWGESGVTELGL